MPPATPEARARGLSWADCFRWRGINGHFATLRRLGRELALSSPRCRPSLSPSLASRAPPLAPPLSLGIAFVARGAALCAAVLRPFGEVAGLCSVLASLVAVLTPPFGGALRARFFPSGPLHPLKNHKICLTENYHLRALFHPFLGCIGVKMIRTFRTPRGGLLRSSLTSLRLFSEIWCFRKLMDLI